MGATSVTEQDQKEQVVDDISKEKVEALEKSVDVAKLAALKARSQAKQQEEKMAAKIVSKKDRSIVMGVLGSGQAGCISGNTNIYLSDYGIIPIEDFFNKKLVSSNLNNIEVRPDKQICIKLDDEEIYTTSINPETGEIVKRKVLAVWKNRKYSKNKITMSNGMSLVCSKTHPSLTFRPKSSRRAFFSCLSSSNPLSINDNLVDSRMEVLDFFKQKTYVRNIEITEDLAWLLGAFCGDGHSSLSGNEISFYSDDKSFTEKIVKLCELIPHTSITVSPRPGCEQIAIFGLQFKLFFETAFDHKNMLTCGGMGQKTYTIDIPTCVSASSAKVRAAFLAGLIDSDGTVCADWCETSVFTTSPNLANKLGCLISTIGGRSALEVIPENKDKNEKEGYRIRLSGKLNHGPLANYICSQISHSLKNMRLRNFLNSEQKSFTTSSVPLKYDDISFWLKKDGKLVNGNQTYENHGISIKNWASDKARLSIPTFNKLINCLEKSDQLDYVNNICSKLLEIESIQSAEDVESDFFDLTVDDYENYVAGNHGFIFTHNSKLSEAFYKLGYDAVAINTALQDLKFIDIPDANKLLLEYGVGGASKELEIGKAAAESHRGEILQLINEKLSNSQVNVLCFSLGGGSGAGSCETLVDIMSSLNKPLVVITVLPMDTEDVQAKSNALETLSKLATFARTKKISNLIVVDNAKIESIYKDANQFEFFNIANKAIVDTLDAFNMLSSMPSSVKGLDPMEFSKILMDGEGLSVYGDFTVDNYSEDTAIAEAVVNNLNNNLLASGFNLKEAKYVGFIITANKDVWAKIPASSINYATAMINDLCGNPKGIFKGVYTVETPDDNVKVYSFFSGLGLPSDRVEQLKKETIELQSKNKGKDEQRSLSLQLNAGANEAVSTAQAVKNKLAAKSSTFGKFLSGSVTDKRK